MALAHRAGLGELVADTLTLKAKGGVNAHLKVPALVAGMVAGADSINDMDVLRHGGMNRLFNGVRSPSTLGTFLRLDLWLSQRFRARRRRAWLCPCPRRSPRLCGLADLRRSVPHQRVPRG